MGELRDELDRLRAVEGSYKQEAKNARHVMDGEWRLGEELLAPWWRMRDAKPTNAQLAEWSAELLQRVAERGLAFALDHPGARALTVVDVDARERFAVASQAYRDAMAERQRFQDENTDALVAEASREQAQRARDAIQAGESIEAIREALA